MVGMAMDTFDLAFHFRLRSRCGVPYEWGDYGAEGEWERTRDVLQILLAIALAYVLASKLEKNAEVLVWARHDRVALGVVIKSLRSVKAVTRQLRQEIAVTAYKELEPDPFRLWGMRPL